jgi:hypothetical protein
VAAELIDEWQARHAFRETGLAIGQGEREVETTIKSALRRGATNPRSVGIGDQASSVTAP